jgi:multidrug efflux pump subunit AcrA (membrane-fusion protein)
MGGNGHYNGGNGNGGRYAPAEDFLAYIDLTKPRLFPSHEEVIKKTGVCKNLCLGAIILAASICFCLYPTSVSITDSSAITVPVQRTDLASPKDGFLKRVFFREGQEVHKGDLLMVVEAISDKALREESQLEYEALAREISAEGSELKILSLRLKEVQRLRELGSIKNDAVTEAYLAHEAKTRKIEALKIRLKQVLARQNYLNQTFLIPVSSKVRSCKRVNFF